MATPSLAADLHDEVLSEILQYFVAECNLLSTTALREQLSWIAVTHVSRHWRATALACPHLWSMIPVSDCPEMAEEFIRRSGSSLLTLVLPSLHARSWNVPSHRLEKWMETIRLGVAQVKRAKCVILFLSSTTGLNILLELYRANPQLPELKHLRISGAFASTVKGLLSEFPRWTPQLRTLDISGEGFGLPTVLPATITHLTLNSLRTARTAPIAAPDAARLWSSVPALEELTLEGILSSHFEFNFVHAQPPPSKQHLARLKSLNLYDRAYCCEVFLDDISFPVSCKLCIKLSVPDVQFEKQSARKVVDYVMSHCRRGQAHRRTLGLASAIQFDPRRPLALTECWVPRTLIDSHIPLDLLEVSSEPWIVMILPLSCESLAEHMSSSIDWGSVTRLDVSEGSSNAWLRPMQSTPLTGVEVVYAHSRCAVTILRMLQHSQSTGAPGDPAVENVLPNLRTLILEDVRAERSECLQVLVDILHGGKSSIGRVVLRACEDVPSDRRGIVGVEIVEEGL